MERRGVGGGRRAEEEGFEDGMVGRWVRWIDGADSKKRETQEEEGRGGGYASSPDEGVACQFTPSYFVQRKV